MIGGGNKELQVMHPDRKGMGMGHPVEIVCEHPSPSSGIRDGSPSSPGHVLEAHLSFGTKTPGFPLPHHHMCGLLR